MISTIWNKLCNRESITYIIFGVLTTAVDWVTYAVLWAAGADYVHSLKLGGGSDLCVYYQQIYCVPKL